MVGEVEKFAVSEWWLLEPSCWAPSSRLKSRDRGGGCLQGKRLNQQQAPWRPWREVASSRRKPNAGLPASWSEVVWPEAVQEKWSVCILVPCSWWRRITHGPAAMDEYRSSRIEAKPQPTTNLPCTVEKSGEHEREDPPCSAQYSETQKVRLERRSFCGGTGGSLGICEWLEK